MYYEFINFVFFIIVHRDSKEQIICCQRQGLCLAGNFVQILKLLLIITDSYSTNSHFSSHIAFPAEGLQSLEGLFFSENLILDWR